MAGSRRSSYKWTQAELDKLDDLLGNLPFPHVVQHFSRWLTAEGLRPRSRRSVEHAAYKLAGSRLPFGRWVRVGDVARALDRWPSTVWDWAKRGWIRRIHAGTASAVCRDDLIKLARQRPELFGGSPREGLLLILEDPDLVDQIRRDYPSRVAGIGGTRRVRWHGQVFPSIGAAARAAHVSEAAIRAGLKAGRLVCGMKFEALD